MAAVLVAAGGVAAFVALRGAGTAEPGTEPGTERDELVLVG